MDEFGLIRKYFQRPPAGPDVIVGNGDDCAVLQIPQGNQLVLSVDTVVEGRHFLSASPPAGVASRALCAALSDLAAMGAKARWFTLAIALPEVNHSWLSEFSRGLFEVADTAGCELIGGDTTRGHLTVTVQVHGTVPAGSALTRSGARPGDSVYVSGSLGDGAAALACLQGRQSFNQSATDYLTGRFYRPEPQLELGERIRGLASAAVDISDGLLADLSHICSASGVGAEVDVQWLPLHQSWAGQVESARAVQWALSGGDDYQLCFTVSPANEPALAQLGLPLTKIGTITTGQSVVVLEHSTPISAPEKGFNHFG